MENKGKTFAGLAVLIVVLSGLSSGSLVYVAEIDGRIGWDVQVRRQG